MKFLTDIFKAKPIIEETIKTYGHAPEHNFYWYQYSKKPKEENVFVQFPDGTGLLTVEYKAKGIMYLFSTPLAPPEKRVSVLLAYLDFMLAKSEIQRVEVELESAARRELLHALPSYLRSRSIIATMISPVMDLMAFDPSLPGAHFKSLRNARNKFYREHAIQLVDARTCRKEELRSVVDAWRLQRHSRDRAEREQYYRLIEANFQGMLTGTALKADGKVLGFNAGWPIPNSKRFYGAIGIHDYSLPDLGLMLYLEDLILMKKTGFAKQIWEGVGRNC